MYYTHYDYLGLPPGASVASIEAAYRTVRQQLGEHTDPKLVCLIDEAYMVLSDATLRFAYDRELLRIADAADRELKALLDKKVGRLPRQVQDVPAPLIATVNAWAA